MVRPKNEKYMDKNEMGSQKTFIMYDRELI